MSGLNGSSRVLTTGQIAKALRVAPRTVSKWFDAGRIKGYRLPGSNGRRVLLRDFLAFARTYGFPEEQLAGHAWRVGLLVGLSIELASALATILPGKDDDGFEWLAAIDAFEAGSVAFVEGANVSLAVVDLGMLGINEGLSICRSLVNHPARPVRTVILLAPEDVSADSLPRVECGATLVLQKPVDPRILAEHVGTLTARTGQGIYLNGRWRVGNPWEVMG